MKEQNPRLMNLIKQIRSILNIRQLKYMFTNRIGSAVFLRVGRLSEINAVGPYDRQQQIWHGYELLTASLYLGRIEEPEEPGEADRQPIDIFDEFDDSEEFEDSNEFDGYFDDDEDEIIDDLETTQDDED